MRHKKCQGAKAQCLGPRSMEIMRGKSLNQAQNNYVRLALGVCGFKLRIHKWCRRPESNRHGVLHRQILNLLRLPISPLRLKC